MARQLITPRSPTRQVADQPATTLTFVDNDDPYIRSITETYKEKRTEKSVHFASDDEVVSSESVTGSLTHSGEQLISWIPSEHLYSEDTFIPETQTQATTTVTSSGRDTTEATPVSYGSSTFIEESEDDTKTETISHTAGSDSVSTSEVFSSRSISDTYREWKDVTEIVKDIEELEESEFVPRFRQDDDDTDIDDSLEEEMSEEAKQNFLLATLSRLRLGCESPSETFSQQSSYMESKLKRPSSKLEMTFCQKMIQRCKSKSDTTPHTAPVIESELISRQDPTSKGHAFLEEYGISSAVVDRLKMKNWHDKMKQKSKQLDKEIEESEKNIKHYQEKEAEMAKQRFLSQMASVIQNENTEERIQAHLIKMHPVKWFADFVIGLPKVDEDVREILYKYKRQIEMQMEDEKQEKS